jgi:hypothetical protein
MGTILGAILMKNVFQQVTVAFSLALCCLGVNLGHSFAQQPEAKQLAPAEA